MHTIYINDTLNGIIRWENHRTKFVFLDAMVEFHRPGDNYRVTLLHCGLFDSQCFSLFLQ